MSRSVLAVGSCTAHHRPRSRTRCPPGTTGRPSRRSLTSSPRSPRKARRTSFRGRAHRHLRQRRHALVRAADVLPTLLRARPREGARPAASGVEGQGALRLAAQGRLEGRAGRRRAARSLEIVMATHAGMTTEEFEKIVKDWIATAKHPEVQASPTPSASISRCSNCSPTCGRTASRPSSSPAAASSSCARGRRRSTASRPSRSSAAASRRSSRCATASPCSCGCRRSNFIDDKAGKPVGINQHIGRRPIAAFGNSDGDQQMLEYTQAGAGARFMMLRASRRREREYAYGPARTAR